MFFSHCAKLGSKFSEPAQPSAPPNPKIIAWNDALAAELGLSDLSLETRTDWFSGKTLPPQCQAVAAGYAGHPSGHFVPGLGDGRAILLGELPSRGSGEFFDVQLKGAGPTAFSRGGDGFAALGPVIREYLLSEYMNTMHVPTTRSLAACLSGATVYRQEAQPGAVLARVASSHIRVGSFEYHRYREDISSLKILLNYCIDRHYPALRESRRPAFDFFKQVSARLSELVSNWMALGFIHGVLNTDNTSVAGITIDYGPCAFLDEYNSEKVFSSIDRNGRYRYSLQAAILQWNLARLAECLLPIEFENSEKVDQRVVDEYGEQIQAFLPEAQLKTQKKISCKLGLDPDQGKISLEDSKTLVDMWLSLLQKHSLDYTRSWKSLEAIHLGKSQGYNDFAYESEEFKSFFKLWQLSLPDPKLLAKNPFYIPRNHIAEKVIQLAKSGDYSLFQNFHECLSQPLSQNDKWKGFEQEPLPHERLTETFCGT